MTGTVSGGIGLGLIVIAAGATAAPLSAQEARVTIAVFPFDDAGALGRDPTQIDALRQRIANLLAEALVHRRTVDVVRAAHFAKGLRQVNLGPRSRIDAATASRLAAAAGARFALTGNFVDHFGRFRLTAHLIDVETGRVIKMISNDDPALQRAGDLPRIVEHHAGRITAEVTRRPH